jgi:hypothetical protein
MGAGAIPLLRNVLEQSGANASRTNGHSAEKTAKTE